MRYGLLSDVHANLPALRAVLAALDAAGVDALVVAGDLVGYGASPDACVEALHEAGARCVAGNHDLYACGRLAPGALPPLAQRSLAWTREHLGDDVRAHLGRLPLTLDLGDLVVAHGSLEDPEEYVTSDRQARAQLSALQPASAGTRRTLVLGHTHRQWLWTAERGSVMVRSGGSQPRPAQPHVVNPGSVGQSRQRERRPRARFGLLDTEGERLELCAIDYDVAASLRDLERAGLPAESLHLVPPLRRQVRRAVGGWARDRLAGR